MTDAALTSAAKLAELLGTALITVGNPEKHMTQSDSVKFQKVFGEKFNIGINAETADKLDAVRIDNADLSKVKAFIAFGEKQPDISSPEFSAVQSTSASVKADVVFPLITPFEADGLFGGETRISKVVEPACCSCEEIINKVINHLK